MRERGVDVGLFSPLPMAPPADGPVLVRGACTRVEIDAEQTLLMPNALTWDQLPPLRLKHGPEAVGEIIALEYVRLGAELQVTARVDDAEAARMPAFSICFTPEAYELVDRGGPWRRWRTAARCGARSLSGMGKHLFRAARLEDAAARQTGAKTGRFGSYPSRAPIIRLAGPQGSPPTALYVPGIGNAAWPLTGS